MRHACGFAIATSPHAPIAPPGAVHPAAAQPQTRIAQVNGRVIVQPRISHNAGLFPKRLISRRPNSIRSESWAGGTEIRTAVGMASRQGIATIALGNRAGQQAAVDVVDILLEDIRPHGVDPRDLRRGAVGRFPHARIPGGQARSTGAEPGRAGGDRVPPRPGPDEPLGLDGDHLPRRAGGELVVAAEEDGRRLVSPHPEPEQLVVAAQVDFRTGQPRGATRNPQPSGPLKTTLAGNVASGKTLNAAWLVVNVWMPELFSLTAWITCSMVGEGRCQAAPTARRMASGEMSSRRGERDQPGQHRQPQAASISVHRLFQQFRHVLLDFVDPRRIGDDDGNLIRGVAPRAVQHEHLARRRRDRLPPGGIPGDGPTAGPPRSACPPVRAVRPIHRSTARARRSASRATARRRRRGAATATSRSRRGRRLPGLDRIVIAAEFGPFDHQRNRVWPGANSRPLVERRADRWTS